MRVRPRLIASLACAFAAALVWAVPRTTGLRDEAGAPHAAEAGWAAPPSFAEPRLAEIAARLRRDPAVTRGDGSFAVARASAVHSASAPQPGERLEWGERDQLDQLDQSDKSDKSDEPNAPEREAQARARRAWPYFERVPPSPGRVSTALRGVDPGAPRRLELWRVDGAPHRVATTRSDEAARFDFGQQLLPLHGVELQVVPSETAGVHALDAPRASRVRLRFDGAGS